MSVCDAGQLHSIEQAISALKSTLKVKLSTQTLALLAAHQHILAHSLYA